MWLIMTWPSVSGQGELWPWAMNAANHSHLHTSSLDLAVYIFLAILVIYQIMYFTLLNSQYGLCCAIFLLYKLILGHLSYDSPLFIKYMLLYLKSLNNLWRQFSPINSSLFGSVRALSYTITKQEWKNLMKFVIFAKWQIAFELFN